MTATVRASGLRRPPAPPRLDRRQATGVVLLCAVAGAATLARPTGALVVDLLWCAALAAGGALLGRHSQRGPLVIAAGTASIVAPDRASLLVGACALTVAIASTDDQRRSAPFLRSLAGGAAVCALLVGSRHDRSMVAAGVGWVVVVGVLVGSARRHAPSWLRHRATTVLVAGTLIVLGFCLVAGFAALSARQQADRGAQALEQGLHAARSGDVTEARHQLRSASDALARASSTMRTWGIPARAVPGAAQNVRFVSTVLDDAADAALRAHDAAGLVDEDALAVRSGQVDLAAVASLHVPLTVLSESLRTVLDDIERLGDAPLVPPIRSRLERMIPDARRGLHDAEIGSRAATVVPEMLGADGTRRYLVLFTSPAEARGRFGFPASYGVLTATDGRINLEVAESIGVLQERSESATGPMPVGDPRVAPYVTYGATRNWRSVTIPPDFPTVATLARDLWRETGTGRIDGVIRLDTTSLAALAELTGPIEIEGRSAPLTAQNITRYLEFDQYVEFESDGSFERREALEDLASEIFDRLLDQELPEPRALADVFSPMVEQGHVQMVTFEPEPMALLDQIGASGRFGPPSTPDALVVAGTNMTGNKIDSFLRRTVRYEAVVTGRSVRATATIALDNTAPAAGLPDYVIGNALDTGAPPRGTNRSVVMVWSPFPLERAMIDGRPVAAASNRTGRWWLHTVDVDIPARSTVSVELTLAGEAATAGTYAVEMLPGGGSAPDAVTIRATDGDGHPLLHQTATLRSPLVVRSAGEP